MKYTHRLPINVMCHLAECKTDNFKVELFKNGNLKKLILWNRKHKKHDKSLCIIEI